MPVRNSVMIAPEIPPGIPEVPVVNDVFIVPRKVPRVVRHYRNDRHCGARLLDRSGSAGVSWRFCRLASSVRDLLGRLPAHALPARLPDATDLCVPRIPSAALTSKVA